MMLREEVLDDQSPSGTFVASRKTRRSVLIPLFLNTAGQRPRRSYIVASHLGCRLAGGIPLLVMTSSGFPRYDALDGRLGGVHLAFVRLGVLNGWPSEQPSMRSTCRSTNIP